jgi:NitT/TauT family transport system permease protein
VRPYLKAIVVIDTGDSGAVVDADCGVLVQNPESRIFFILLVILLPFYALNVYEGTGATEGVCR